MRIIQRTLEATVLLTYEIDLDRPAEDDSFRMVENIKLGMDHMNAAGELCRGAVVKAYSAKLINLEETTYTYNV